MAGVIIGGAVGAAAGSLKHIGIEDSFIEALGEQAQPGTSIPFILEREASPYSVFHDLKKFDGKLLRTSFGYARQQKLRDALERKK